MLFSSMVRVRVSAKIGFSVWLISGYLLLSIVIVTLPLTRDFSTQVEFSFWPMHSSVCHDVLTGMAQWLRRRSLAGGLFLIYARYTVDM